MNILIDTHILIWAINDDEKLTDKAREILSDKLNTIFYSPISIWEIELKHKLHPDNMQYGGNEVNNFAEIGGYVEFPLYTKQVIITDKLVRKDDIEHNDPFDKMLLAQAIANEIYFMTHDKLFSGYDYQNIILV